VHENERCGHLTPASDKGEGDIPTSELQDLMQSGVQAHQAGRLPAAKAVYEKVLASEPDHADANHLLGVLAHQMGRAEIAVRLISKAIRRNPFVAGYHVHLGYALHELGRLDEAIASYQEALRIDPSFAPAHMNLGNAQAQQTDLDGAIASYRKALTINPNLADAHMNLGTALVQQDHLDDAVASYRKALAINPNLADAHSNLGNALTRLGRLDEAIASCQEALRIDPNFTQAHMNLGNALAQRKGQLDDAVTSYRNALAINPNLADAHSNLGNALTRLGRLDEAIASYQEALRIDPSFAQAHMNLGNALLQQNHLDEAVASYRNALAIDPNLAEAHMNLGIALKGQGRLEDAVASYREALRIDPHHAEANSNLGKVLQNLGRIDEAITHFQSVGTDSANAKVLECLYAANRTKAFDDYLSALRRSAPANLEVAAISAFAAHQWGAEDPYPFCKSPLDFIYTASIKSALAPFDQFFTQIIQEIDRAPSTWEPRANATKGGFHSIGNLFNLETPEILKLRDVILERIEDYRSRFADRTDGFMTQWPDQPRLTSWHVKLLKSGHMTPHIHASGWLSGVIYLKIPDKLAGDEGTITFSLHGNDFPIRNSHIPTVKHVPKQGDLVLFPSSLFHYTTPFQSDEERHCISFDMLP
jgi:tetratricopeptide (TPR) repeat protein